MSDDDKMQVEEVLEALNKALTLQYRSALQYTVNSGSVFGLEYQAFGDKMHAFAQDELEDARRLVEKITALGADPTVEVAALTWSGDSRKAVERLIETETEAIDALKCVIPPSGNEGRSEALEHLMEHLIMRKQNQVDFLLRALRRS